MSQKVLIFAHATKKRPFDFNEMKGLQEAGFRIYVVGTTSSENESLELLRQGFVIQPNINTAIKQLQIESVQPEDVTVVCRAGQEPYPRLPYFVRWLIATSEMVQWQQVEKEFAKLIQVQKDFNFHLMCNNEPFGIARTVLDKVSDPGSPHTTEQAVYMPKQEMYTPLRTSYCALTTSERSTTTCSAEFYTQLDSTKPMSRSKLTLKT
jgi:hypothetical protein